MVLDMVVAVLIQIASIVLMPFVPFAVLFRRYLRTDEITVWGEGGEGKMVVKRSALPRWLWWFQTPDEPLPGGMYEPTVRDWYLTFGDYVCSVLWLWRNPLYGLSWAFGKPARDYLDPVHGGIARWGRLWRWWKQFGPFVVQAGWKVHRKDFDARADIGPFWAIRFISIRLLRNA